MEQNKLNGIIIQITLSIIAISFVVISILLVKITFNQKVEEVIFGNVMTIEEVASYLSISQGEVIDIMEAEKTVLEKNGTFSGLMFPYYTINKKYYFVKSNVDDWLKEISANRRKYDLKNKTIY